MIRRLIFFLCLLWLWCPFSFAHEVRPAYLHITEAAPAKYDVLWKQPATQGMVLSIHPTFDEDCTATEPLREIFENSLVTRWQLNCAQNIDLVSSLSIEGLDRTLTDVFLRADFIEKPDIETILRPGMKIEQAAVEARGAPQAYLKMGIDHIVFAPDHVLFVLGILLLVRFRQLLQVVTAFTIGHSVTLAITALGWVSVPSAPVEILIALSIAFVAAEIIRKNDTKPSWLSQRPWILSGGFGLLHGFGFAGVLGEIGLPADTAISALLFFNIGVELGQLILICIFTVVFCASLYLANSAKRAWLYHALAMSIGVAGAFWTIERFTGMIL